MKCMERSSIHTVRRHTHTNAHPVFSVTGQDMNGRWITVAVAVMKRAEKLRFKIVTVIVVDEKSRHRKG